MKIFLSLCIGIIFSGAAYSLYNAANDYGLATVSLPPAIIAQQDDTSGWGDNTSGGGGSVLSGYIMIPWELTMPAHSDDSGTLDIGYIVVHRMKPNTVYDCTLRVQYCYESPNPESRCDKSKEGIFIVEISPWESLGDSTNGDGTN